MIRAIVCGAALFAAGCEQKEASGVDLLNEITPVVPDGAYIGTAVYSPERGVLCADLQWRGEYRDNAPTIIVHFGDRIVVYTVNAAASESPGLEHCDAEDAKTVLETRYR